MNSHAGAADPARQLRQYSLQSYARPYRKVMTSPYSSLI
jgi:hypothetical protein